MRTETYVTQQKATELLEEHFSTHGKGTGRNLHYLLNDQRRGRTRGVIPYVKLGGRVFYRIGDLRTWAAQQIAMGREEHSGVFTVEGATELERLAKLSSVATVLH